MYPITIEPGLIEGSHLTRLSRVVQNLISRLDLSTDVIFSAA